MEAHTQTHSRRPQPLQSFASLFTENLGLKVTSLVIALALFTVLRTTGSLQRVIELPVVARLPDPGLRRVLLTELPDKVHVTVRGSPSIVRALRPEDMDPVVIDLSHGDASRVTFDAAMFHLPPGVQTQADDYTRPIELQWDDLVDRTVPVRVTTSGTAPGGMKLAGAPVAVPDTVHVSGPALYVDALTFVRTDPIDISLLAPGEHTRRVALERPRERVRYDRASGVRAVLTLVPDVATREIAHVAVVAVGAAQVQLHPATATLTLRGPPDVLEHLDPGSLVPTVDLPADASATRGTYRLQVVAGHLPAGVTLVSVEPTEVIVTPVR